MSNLECGTFKISTERTNSANKAESKAENKANTMIGSLLQFFSLPSTLRRNPLHMMHICLSISLFVHWLTRTNVTDVMILTLDWIWIFRRNAPSFYRCRHYKLQTTSYRQQTTNTNQSQVLAMMKFTNSLPVSSNRTLFLSCCLIVCALSVLSPAVAGSPMNGSCTSLVA